jgi:alkylation response protein AidB-like acyl-CoA dehydrogenase
MIMNESTSEDLEALRASVRSFLEDKSPSREVRRLMATEDGFDKDVWRQMAEQLGLQGLAIPESYGGSGFGYVELLVVFEEMGRALFCGPYFSTVALAASLLIHSGDEELKALYLPEIASGNLIATVSLTEDGESWSEQGISTRAVKTAEGGWVLTGTANYVIDGGVADVLFIPAQTESEVNVFAVEAESTGLTRTPLGVMDATRKQVRVDLSGTPARQVSSAGAGWTLINKVQLIGAIALAGEQVGGAQKVLEESVEYAKTRQQFGRFIGSFQAIKHKCANIYLESESAAVVARYAAWTADADLDDMVLAASMAKAYCSEAFAHAAAENIQIHGGVGFTWENDAHLYLRRAKTSELYLGDATTHREVIAGILGI